MFGLPDQGFTQRAIFVFYASEDRNLTRVIGELRSLLRAADIRLYAAEVQKDPQPGQRPQPRIPGIGLPEVLGAMTGGPVAARVALRELAQETGGEAHATRWSIRDMLQAARH